MTKFISRLSVPGAIALGVGLFSVLAAAAVLVLHVAPYVGNPDGQCMLQQQPGILIGESPHLLVQLECSSGEPAPPAEPVVQQSAPPDVPQDEYSTPPGVIHVRGGGFLVNCQVSQCTTLPDAGPDGTTCAEPDGSLQVCR